MHYKVKNVAAHRVTLGDLPGRTHVEVYPRIALAAKTVDDLRKMTDFPEFLAITRGGRETQTRTSTSCHAEARAMQREHAVRQQARQKGYRLEHAKSDGSFFSRTIIGE